MYCIYEQLLYGIPLFFSKKNGIPLKIKEKKCFGPVQSGPNLKGLVVKKSPKIKESRVGGQGGNLEWAQGSSWSTLSPILVISIFLVPPIIND